MENNKNNNSTLDEILEEDIAAKRKKKSKIFSQIIKASLVTHPFNFLEFH